MAASTTSACCCSTVASTDEVIPHAEARSADMLAQAVVAGIGNTIHVEKRVGDDVNGGDSDNDAYHAKAVDATGNGDDGWVHSYLGCYHCSP